ncbi:MULTISPECIES: flagellar protein FliT [unclassified Cytobacillus]|uniref:flagellar protein FliT n=1 Tax=unclassified Cytobacillus TaxID=2675268 RepID=UPI002041A952|nr:flagellar protein FliT [Cytobacillus sp. AMY 15.2]MCM3092528.1 flagellar protein FliT [Cytobacillus sp. AMY 15.2]
MSSVQDFYDATQKLIALLEDAALDRDEKISQVEYLLEHRQQAMAGMEPPFSDSEKDLGARLISLNSKVTALMTREKLFIQKDLKDLSVKKETTGKYANPYQSMATDGMFYDKRK